MDVLWFSHKEQHRIENRLETGIQELLNCTCRLRHKDKDLPKLALCVKSTLPGTQKKRSATELVLSRGPHKVEHERSKVCLESCLSWGA
eukprot:71494-Pelagomonas_calceolata.AAC.1